MRIHNAELFKGGEYRVETPTHAGVIQFLSTDLIRYERIDFYQERKVIVDTFGSSWLLGWGAFSPDTISPISGPLALPLTGLYCIFIPSYSSIYWQVHPGSFRWSALVSPKPLPHFQRNQPLVFPVGRPPQLEDRWAIERFLLEHCQNSRCQILENQLTFSRKARLVKELLDKDFREPFSIKDVAAHLKLNPIPMTRCFTLAYGLSPIKYRQRLRLLEAMRLMNQGFSVTDAIFGSGFTNLSEFHRQFKETFHTNPKSFSPQHQLGLNRHFRK